MHWVLEQSWTLGFSLLKVVKIELFTKSWTKRYLVNFRGYLVLKSNRAIEFYSSSLSILGRKQVVPSSGLFSLGKFKTDKNLVKDLSIFEYMLLSLIITLIKLNNFS